MKATVPGAAGLVLLSLAACSPTVVNHGHTVDPELLAQIHPGSSTRSDVMQALGSPSTLGTFDDDRWYYISQRTEQKSFYQTDVVAQDVVTVNFDKQGVVSDIGKVDLADAREITPSADRTRTMGNELTLLQQFIGNLGRFNNDQSTDAAREAMRRRGSTIPGG